MFRKFGISLALISALTVAQLPLVVVQICSWVGMYSDFVEETGSVQTSIHWVFDGQHRCEGCDFVSQQVAESDDQPEPSPDGMTCLKLQLAMVDEVEVVESPAVVGKLLFNAQFLFGVSMDPITPPPRFC